MRVRLIGPFPGNMRRESGERYRISQFTFSVNIRINTIEAAVTRKRDTIYQAAMLDPHTAAELSIDDIVAMCDELIEAHGDYLPAYH